MLRQESLPIVDVSPLVSGRGSAGPVAEALRSACRDSGFFYAVGHGVDPAQLARLEQCSRDFFALGLEQKLEIAMARGGRAWRGYFPVGAELTRGRPDQKEGIYFGAELGPEHPEVRAGTPLHGSNLFPAGVPALRHAVLAHLEAMTRLGHALMKGIALSLGLDAAYFEARHTGEPLVLFRIFHYPALSEAEAANDLWSVGEHTDYGLLTILAQSDEPGLEVRTPRGWIAAPPVPGAFVCNIGDMLDRMTAGLYRSTPHRVRNLSGRDRLSFPFFFDPGFHTAVRPIESGAAGPDDASERWDGRSVRELGGTYGDYLLSKVSQVFPELRRRVISA